MGDLRMKSYALGIAIIATGLLLVGLGIYAEVSLWSECRADHSWLYCLRVLQ